MERRRRTKSSFSPRTQRRRDRRDVFVPFSLSFSHLEFGDGTTPTASLVFCRYKPSCSASERRASSSSTPLRHARFLLSAGHALDQGELLRNPASSKLIPASSQGKIALGRVDDWVMTADETARHLLLLHAFHQLKLQVERHAVGIIADLNPAERWLGFLHVASRRLRAFLSSFAAEDAYEELPLDCALVWHAWILSSRYAAAALNRGRRS